MLDKTKAYQDVYGKPGVRYAQDDKLYNGMELEVDWNGKILEEVDKTVFGPKESKLEPEPEKKVEPPDTEEDKPSLAWKDQPESAESKEQDPAEDPAEFELIDRIKVKVRSNPLYLKKNEIKIELEARKVEYDAKESRDDLLKRLKDHLGV